MILRVDVVDGDREAEADARDRRVDPDDAAAAVRERAARVAGVQRRVGLDDVVHDPARRPERTGSERPSAETTPAVTEPAKPCGFPMATTSWPTRSVSASPRTAGDELVRLGAEHGEIGERVGADDLGRDLAAVHEGRLHRPSVPATTWADVSMKPSGVITTPLPPPTALRPPRTRARRAGWPPTARAARRS